VGFAKAPLGGAFREPRSGRCRTGVPRNESQGCHTASLSNSLIQYRIGF